MPMPQQGILSEQWFGFQLVGHGAWGPLAGHSEVRGYPSQSNMTA